MWCVSCTHNGRPRFRNALPPSKCGLSLAFTIDSAIGFRAPKEHESDERGGSGTDKFRYLHFPYLFSRNYG
jgi:hypothetical protein